MDLFTNSPHLVHILISALIIVESGGDPEAYNERENAIGVLQIRPICLQDINRFSKITYSEEDIKTEALARLACFEYLKHYAQKIYEMESREVTLEDLARIWVSGPSGYTREASIPYWNKVKVVLDGMLTEQSQCLLQNSGL